MMLPDPENRFRTILEEYDRKMEILRVEVVRARQMVCGASTCSPVGVEALVQALAKVESLRSQLDAASDIMQELKSIHESMSR